MFGPNKCFNFFGGFSIWVINPGPIITCRMCVVGYEPKVWSFLITYILKGCRYVGLHLYILFFKSFTFVGKKIIYQG